MRLRLQPHFALVIATFSVSVVLILSGILYIYFRDAFERSSATNAQAVSSALLERAELRGSEMAGLLSRALADPLFRHDMQAAGGLLRAALAQSDVLFVRAFDAQGRVVASGEDSTEPPGHRIRDEVTLRVLDPAVRESHRIDGDVFIAVHSVRRDDAVLGGLELGLSLAGVQAAIAATQAELQAIAGAGERRMGFAVMLVALGVISMALLVAIEVSRSTVRPIQDLVRYTRDVGHGNYDLPLPGSRHDDLDELAQAFRQMTRNLQASVDEAHLSDLHDTRTGLPDRRLLREYLEHAIETTQRSGRLLAVLLLELDDFAGLHERLGQEACDRVLTEAAERVRRAVRRGDYVSLGRPSSAVARLGGESFVVLLGDLSDVGGLVSAVRRITRDLGGPYRVGEGEIQVGLSAGIAIAPRDTTDALALLRHADVAMHSAKYAGRRFRFYDDDLNAQVQSRLDLEGDLRSALLKEELQIWYQPVVDVTLPAVVGVEALLRWMDPKRGAVSPPVMVQLAEEGRFMPMIGEWVLREACLQVRAWQAATGLPLNLHVNLSSAELNEERLGEQVRTTLAASGLSPNLLQIDIAEPVLGGLREGAQRALRELAGLGVGLWVDDFGSGGGSLGLLQRLPLRGAKVDLTSGAVGNGAVPAATLLAAVQESGLTPLGEGVESAAQLEGLRARGCALYQGRLLAAPMPPREMESWLGDPGALEHLLSADAT